MGEMTHRAEQAGDSVENSEWFDKAIRVGFVAYGVVSMRSSTGPAGCMSASST